MKPNSKVDVCQTCKAVRHFYKTSGKHGLYRCLVCGDRISIMTVGGKK